MPAGSPWLHIVIQGPISFHLFALYPQGMGILLDPLLRLGDSAGGVRGGWMGRGYILEVIVHHFLPTVCGPDLNCMASPSYRGGPEMKFSLMLRVEKPDFVTIR